MRLCLRERGAVVISPSAMPNLQSRLRSLADTFVSGVLGALRGASLSELTALTGGRVAVSPGKRSAKGGAKQRGSAGRRVRRSSDSVAELAARAAAFIKSSGGNVAVSDIAKGLGVDKDDISRPLAVALQQRQIRKTGEKRLTRYFAVSKPKKKLTRYGA